MAASLSGMLRGLVQRAAPVVLRGLRDAQLAPRLGQRAPPLCRFASAAAPGEAAPAGGAGETAQAEAFDSLARYRERPWEYLDSEEYAERYGQREVWTDYRRNHKGGIPPQKTRKTCIRGDKICGNPCPICRDPKLVIHYQNVKLLQQFLSPHTGEVYDSTRTGVCMRQQKSLTRAIDTARDHGLLPVQVPLADFEGKDFSNRHSAVASGHAPPPPPRRGGGPPASPGTAGTGRPGPTPGTWPASSGSTGSTSGPRRKSPPPSEPPREHGGHERRGEGSWGA